MNGRFGLVRCEDIQMSLRWGLEWLPGMNGAKVGGCCFSGLDGWSGGSYELGRIDHR